MRQPDLGFDPFDPPLARRALCAPCTMAGRDGLLLVEQHNEHRVTVCCDTCSFSRLYGPEGPVESDAAVEATGPGKETDMAKLMTSPTSPTSPTKTPDSDPLCCVKSCLVAAKQGGLCDKHYLGLGLLLQFIRLERWINCGKPDLTLWSDAYGPVSSKWLDFLDQNTELHRSLSPPPGDGGEADATTEPHPAVADASSPVTFSSGDGAQVDHLTFPVGDADFDAVKIRKYWTLFDADGRVVVQLPIADAPRPAMKVAGGACG